MEFDELILRELPDGTTMTYGVVAGRTDDVVLIKSGRGGDCRGYEDKYVYMAHRIRARRGCTVICSPNPVDADTYAEDEAVIRAFAAKAGKESFALGLLGSSNGGYQILRLAERMPETRRVVCVNMPLMINFHRITRVLAGLAETDKIFAYGERDASYSYVPFLENKGYPRFSMIRVAGADHNFLNQTEDFLALGDLV